MNTIGGKFRATALVSAATLALAFAMGAQAQDRNSEDQYGNGGGNGNPNSNDNTWPYARTDKPPVVAVVGDVACQPGETELPGEKAGENCAGDVVASGPLAGELILNASQAATAKQIEAMQPNLVALVGDEQYQVAQYSDFENSYELTYGAFKLITRPAPGNHEFYTEHGAIGVAGYGYFSYFNGVQHNADGSMMTATIAGNPDTGGTFTQPVPYSDGQAGHFDQSGGLGTSTGVGATEPAGGPVGVGNGWYSFNLGGWHFISLNIECETQPGGCSATGSWFASELAWLKNDLAENHSACTAAYWHQPTFSATNGISEEGVTAQAFWELLYQYGADLVLNGHDHLYARYRPLDASGNSDPKKGLTEFIVGTGGETLDPIVNTGSATASDPSGNPNFNAENLVAGSGYYWGVMGLTLYPNGYAWNFQSALKDPTQTTAGAIAAPAAFNDQGFGFCHGGPGNYGGPGGR
jgi:acid phosphatase type 7